MLFLLILEQAPELQPPSSAHPTPRNQRAIRIPHLVRPLSLRRLCRPSPFTPSLDIHNHRTSLLFFPFPLFP